jgi:hypothetical protein
MTTPPQLRLADAILYVCGEEAENRYAQGFQGVRERRALRALFGAPPIEPQIFRSVILFLAAQ